MKIETITITDDENRSITLSDEDFSNICTFVGVERETAIRLACLLDWLTEIGRRG